MATEEKKMAEVDKAKEEFVREYMIAQSFSEYVNMVGITYRFIAEWLERRGDNALTASIDEAERIKEELIRAGEDPEEYYIHVGLVKPLPEGMSLPDVYKGFKVFVMVIGEIIPY